MDGLNILMRNDAFLGRGWAFPPVIGEHGARMVAYEKDIEQNLHVLFSTSPGERVGRYDYGSPLRKYIFEPMTEQTIGRMRNDIARAVTLFEPRIELEDVSFELHAEEGELLIQLAYTVIRTNNRNNMVYPFYFNEGMNKKEV